MSLERDAERGRLAEEVLANEVYAESWEQVERGLKRKWWESRDAEEREALHRLAQSLRAARLVLEATMRSWKVALADLERKRTLAERIGLRLAQR